ncbi:phosphate acetyltransferase [Bacteroidetes bacterium endosymbiont of Geopemphigus sp.]|uniref:phosphate acetyltransferase n=1 Tax=Bacteroidetes bacterium endosymbiont of Geopemphigus sp. TaxID=2047937 RepID=UPI000CD1008C|nr:phosphate acetyltransferase [Bacteroidetes bacterium endosymbiont of Geopemphigus sp.]
MNQSVFIFTTDPDSGKFLVTLGIMQAIMKKTVRVAFFRPIIEQFSHSQKDDHITTVLDHFQLIMQYEEAYGFKRDEAVALYNAGKKNRLFDQIFSKYKKLEERFDFVVVEGPDFFNESSSFDFDLNNSVAKNLHLPVILVVNGEKKTADALADHVLIEQESIERNVIMIVVNKTHISTKEINKYLKNRLPSEIILVTIPPEPLLSKPTLRELKNELKASLITGKAEDLNKIAMTSIIGAMQLSHYLTRIEEDSLVITSGDRADLICATILANASVTYAHVAGILLTGGTFPEENLLKLMKGFLHAVPILAVDTDTFETTQRVASIKPRIYPDNIIKIQRSINLFEEYVNSPLIEKKIAAFQSSSITLHMFRYNLLKKSREAQKHIVLPEGLEERILRAASLFTSEKLGNITLLGSPKKILSEFNRLGLPWDEDRISLTDPSVALCNEDFSNTLFQLRKEKGLQYDQAYDLMLDVSYFGTMMVYKGLADGMVSGAVHTTAHTIRPALQFIKTSPGVKTISSVFFMLLNDRVLVYGDCAIVPDPDPEQLADITIASAKTAQNFGIDPKIALLSYSSGNSGSGQHVDKVRKAVEIVKSRTPQLLIEGPIQYDAAVDPVVGKQKMPDSSVAGQANVLIFPDLNTGNNTYKAVQRETKTLAIGPVLQGLKKPVNDLSRGATVEDIYNTIIITSIQAARS